MMSLIKGLPRDKWEWGVIASRSFIGSGLCMLVPLDINQSKPIFDTQYDLAGAKIWFLAEGDNHLLLIIMAVIMAALLIIEISLAHVSRRLSIRQRGAEFDPEKRTATPETLGYNQYSGISETNLDAQVGKN